ncbi:MAG: CHAP domain-containing protein [Ruminococcus sp.]|nr:CHAP domain-containing protein [Ruminococcus sp.]
MKRIIAMVLLVLLTVVPVASVCVFAGGNAEDYGISQCAVEFTPRLTAPSSSNKYYYSNLNILYAAGYGMPNCTAYAWGRAYEILGTQPKLSLNNADGWYNYNKTNNYYPYGKTPKLGAIACWNNPSGGHVAVVEDISSTTITFSNSGYGYKTFYLTHAEIGEANAGVYSYGWTFLGYIYILDGVKEPEGDVYRVDSNNGLNMRKGAGTSYSVLTAIPDDTEIVVTATKKANGYTWGKTTYAGYTGWCVLDFCELIYKKPVETQPVVPETTIPETTVTETTVPETTIPESSATMDEPPLFAPAPSLPADPVEKPVDLADLDGDGKVTITDATALQKNLAGIKVEILTDKADIDGDGKVTISDATYIQKYLAAIV